MQIKDYGYLLRDDPLYAEKAKKVSALTRDISEAIAAENLDTLQINGNQRIAFHSPCTLQHGQQLSGRVEEILQRLGFTLTQVVDSHLCCGSAGTYSILQAEISSKLLRRKLEALTIDQPDRIVTANIGCQLHLSTGSKQPIQHWIELLDQD